MIDKLVTESSGTTDDNNDSDTTTTSRIDRQLNKLEHYFFRFLSVKMKLKSFLDNKNKEYNFNLINQAVITINKVAFSTYHLINLFFLEIVEKNLTIPKLDQTFFRQCCSYASKLKGEWTVPPLTDPIRNVTIKYQRFIDESDWSPPDREGLSHLVTNLAVQILNDTLNHLELNFRNRFRKYLKLHHLVTDGAKTIYIVDHIFGLRTIDPKRPSKFDENEPPKELITQYKKLFNFPTEETKIIENLNIYLPFYWEILKCFEEKGEGKLFTLAPTKGDMIPGHVKICTSSLHDILSHDFQIQNKLFKEKQRIEEEKYKLSKVKGKSENTFKSNIQIGIERPENHVLFRQHKLQNWENISNYKKYETKNHWFNGEISTDGYSVTVSYKIPNKKDFPFSFEEWNNKMTDDKKVDWCKLMLQKRKEEWEIRKAEWEKQRKFKGPKHEALMKPCWNNWSRHLGLDPGHRSLFTTTDDKGCKTQCRKKEYQHLTGQKMRRTALNRRRDANPVIKELHDLSLKVRTTEQYLNSLKGRLAIYAILDAEYSKGYYRKMKFGGYLKKQMTFNILTDRLIGDHKGSTVIGYGVSGGNMTGLKGSHMPVKGFKNHLNKCPDVKVQDIDEWGTTIKCNACRSRTKVVKEWKEIKKQDEEPVDKLTVIYGLRRCKNSECRITWDRDLNASKNILCLLEHKLRGEARPSYLKRDPTPIKPVPKKLGKKSKKEGPKKQNGTRSGTESTAVVDLVPGEIDVRGNMVFRSPSDTISPCDVSLTQSSIKSKRALRITLKKNIKKK